MELLQDVQTQSYSHLNDLEAPIDDDYGAYDDYIDDTNVLQLDDDRVVESVAERSEEQDGSDKNEVEENEDVFDGILDEDTMAEGLSNLGRSADGIQQVFLRLTLPGFKLRDISLLQECIYIQQLELPYNDLTELSALSYMPNLLELDVSHNLLRHLLDFTPPKNLKSVNYSFNQLDEIGDLSEHHYLSRLVLDNNQISQIRGVERCERLSYLSLAHNSISKIENLDNLPLKYLDLSDNRLEKIENVETLRLLVTVKLAGNFLSSLDGLEGHDFLEVLNLEGNEISELFELLHLKHLWLLRELNLQRNPIRDSPDYRLSVLFHLNRLGTLDNSKVQSNEKVSAYNMFNAPMEVIAARDHMMHVVYSFLQPSRVLDSTLPSVDTPYPILVLCGPQGAGKGDLALKLVEEFPDYFGFGLSHTTRAPWPDEAEAEVKEYNHVTIDEFETDVKMGRFLQTCSFHGQLYGLPLESIEGVAREGLACVLHMELEGVLTLKNSHLEPRYVLVVPLDGAPHASRMRARGVYTDAQTQTALNRVDTYSEYNRNHPGFFDAVINSSDLSEAYKSLRQLVLEYLGITPTPESDTLGMSTNTSAFKLDKEYTEMTEVSRAGGSGRPWSKPSLPDSAGGSVRAQGSGGRDSGAGGSVQGRSTGGGVHPLPGSRGGSARPSRGGAGIHPLGTKPTPATPLTARSTVEEESIRRRQSAARDAVSGTRLSLYEQLLKEAPKGMSYVTTPPDDDVTTKYSRRAYSAPVRGGDLPGDSPDSSDARSAKTLSPTLTNPSDGRRDSSESPVDSLDLGGVRYQVEVEPIEVGSGGSKSNGPMAPREAFSAGSVLESRGSAVVAGERSRPTSREAGSPRPVSGASRPASTGGRPGSERHPVLPPISPHTAQTPPNY